MRIAIATAQVPFIRGGAERLAEGLRDALRDAGHFAEIVALPFKWYPPERILDHMLAWRLVDLSEVAGMAIDLVIALRFPAYLVAHRNKVVWLVHQYRTAYDLWDHPHGDLIHHPNGALVRDTIWQSDRKLLPRATALFSISATVASRLEHHCGIASRVLYPPLQHPEQYYCAEVEEYLFFPSRLTPLKRQSLVLEALPYTRQPIRVRFAGSPDEPPYAERLMTLAARLGVADRVEWLGPITEPEKCRQYAHALGVVFPPLAEDYGYVTLEAMAASKPLLTCGDSGGPLEFVHHGKTGLVSEPTPLSLAGALDAVWADRNRARCWGEAGRAEFERRGISWHAVVGELTV